MRETFVDLGLSPLCETYIDSAHLSAPESFYPLHAFLCTNCFLIQLPEHVGAEEIFREYAYFSSYSDSWVAHAREYVDAMIQRLALDQHSSVIEVASNDCYLLQFFKGRGIPVLGIEPAKNVAHVAMEKGIPTVTSFFGRRLAREFAAETESVLAFDPRKSVNELEVVIVVGVRPFRAVADGAVADQRNVRNSPRYWCPTREVRNADLAHHVGIER